MGGDGAAVGVDDRFADGEADPGARLVPAAGSIAAVEAFEDVGQLGGQDAFARVGDDDGDFVEFWACGDRDASARWCVAERVGEQVAQHLSDAGGVDVNARPGLGRRVDDEVDALVGIAGPDAVGGCGDQLRDVVELAVEAQSPFFCAGDVVDVFGETGQPVGLCREDVSCVGVEVGDAVVEALVVQRSRVASL